MLPCTLYYYNKTGIHIDLLIYSSRNINSAMSHALLFFLYSLWIEFHYILKDIPVSFYSLKYIQIELFFEDILPKYEQITSETLKELFACYNVEFPTDVPGSESIARKILENDIKQFVHAIRSFSKRIVLSSSKKAITPSIPQVEVCVFEVEVVYDDGGDGKEETQFCVFRKVSANFVNVFFLHLQFFYNSI